jgi:hypothetical protein
VKNTANNSTVNWGGDAIGDVSGSVGNDQIVGNGADNHLYDADIRTDTISGGGGDDFIYVNDGAGGDTVDRGKGRDWVEYDAGEVIVPSTCEVLRPSSSG